ncbi:MAG: energy-coupling factor transporter transmembrane component T family protein [Desulfovibrionaceae bacterium]
MLALFNDRYSSFSSSHILANLDTRTKVIISIITSIATLILASSVALSFLFFVSLSYAMLIHKKRLLFFAYIFFIIVACVATVFSLFLQFIFPAMPESSFVDLGIPFLRIAIMLNVVLPLALYTNIHSLLHTLKNLKLPLYIYLPTSVMIRFIPTFISDVKQITEALKIRGYIFSVRACCSKPIFYLRIILVPILFRSLKTADNLSIAAELKGIGYNKKTSIYKVEKWSHKDTMTILLFLITILISFILAHFFVSPSRVMQ